MTKKSIFSTNSFLLSSLSRTFFQSCCRSRWKWCTALEVHTDAKKNDYCCCSTEDQFSLIYSVTTENCRHVEKVHKIGRACRVHWNKIIEIAGGTERKSLKVKPIRHQSGRSLLLLVCKLRLPGSIVHRIHILCDHWIGPLQKMNSNF